MNHTKGPWSASEHGGYGDYNGNSIVILGDDLRVAVVLGYDNDETQANANLIASAPELLEAVQALIDWNEAQTKLSFYDRMEQFNAALDKARAAITKAKGEV